MRTSKGVTLVELLIVIVVMGIISAFAIVAVGKILVNTRLGVDEQTVGTLNTATGYYNFYQGEEAVFAAGLTDAEKLTLLYDKGYVDKRIVPQSKDAAFIWSEEDLTWRLNISGTAVALSPFGDTFTEIAPSIISILKTHNDNYGRTWGDYKYTDIGLDPDDWDNPILHFYYTPQGRTLKIRPEDGYQFIFDFTSGTKGSLKSSIAYSIIYNDVDDDGNFDGNWYYYAVEDNDGNLLYENRIDINTLVVEPY